MGVGLATASGLGVGVGLEWALAWQRRAVLEWALAWSGRWPGNGRAIVEFVYFPRLLTIYIFYEGITDRRGLFGRQVFG